MTISQAIVTWLYTNSSLSVDDVDTDTLAASAAAYGLYKTPQTNVVTYVDGTRDVTAYYTFHVRQRSNAEVARQSNQEFLEGFETWVRTQSHARIFPALASPLECQRVFVANTFSALETETDETIYQLTLGINYIDKAA